ncbi:hypothetical protein [Rhodococcus sp. BP22]|uniref:hypothetical protein n=1 Tax=Rhodococcus sp. BP22 TaxID=2758566 RepID=UPI001648AF90|nr:hypothetical protein [Rhodococcus sp. BP22]
MSWPIAHCRFVALAAQMLAEPGPVRVLGIDEARRGKPMWDRCETTGEYVRQDPWDTVFVDISGRQDMLGQQSGRTSATVLCWLRARS